MSRIKQIIINARVNLFFYLLTIIVAFFSRKIFLDFLGPGFIGLVSLLQEILKFLNLAELGVSTAIGYALYKPLFDKKHEEINNINIFFGFIYRKIGFSIVVLGIIVSLFFPMFFPDTEFSYKLIYYAFFAFLISTTFNYFFNYHITVLQADQKDYVVGKYIQGIGVFKSLCQIVLVYTYKNFYLWVTIELMFSLVLVFVLRWQIKKIYPWLQLNLPKKSRNIKKFPEILTKVRQIVVHKFSFFVLSGTDQILIYWFVNLKSVAFYGNYLLIVGYLSMFINQTFSGAQASVGNLIAENHKSTIKKVFFELTSIRHFLGGFLLVALYHLIDPFIYIWLGETYILESNIVFFILLNIYIGQIRKPVDDFINAYGMFSDTWAPIVEATLNLTISLILGSMYGILGIMIGTTVSLSVIAIIWKPFFLYREGFKESVSEYWIGFFKFLFALVLTFLATDFFKKIFFQDTLTDFFQWTYFAVVLCLYILTIYSILLFLMHQGFRDFIHRLKSLLTKFIKNGKN